MFRIFTAAVLIAFPVFFSWGYSVITIDSECVMLRDIFPGLEIDDEIYCGLDYGETKLINRQMSMYIINKYNIEGGRPGEVTFRRSGTLLTEDRLTRDISELLSVMYSGLDVEIGSIRMGREFYYSEDKGYDIDLPRGRFGNVSVGVSNGIRSYNYTVSLKAFKDIYVAKTSIRKGEDISGKVELQRYDLSRVRGEPLTETEGFIADRNLSAGRPVTKAEVIRKPDAFAGTSVVIIYSEGGLSVTTTGELLDDAYIGKNVRVENSASGKIIRGVYTGDRRVSVNSQ